MYNKFKDPSRCSLSPASLFDYLYINYNMGPVEDFNPNPATQYWFKQKHRSAHANTKCRKQEWFNGVFRGGGTGETHHQPIIEF